MRLRGAAADYRLLAPARIAPRRDGDSHRLSRLKRNREAADRLDALLIGGNKPAATYAGVPPRPV
jgi:hypothetical protein